MVAEAAVEMPLGVAPADHVLVADETGFFASGARRSVGHDGQGIAKPSSAKRGHTKDFDCFALIYSTSTHR
jgi:hypothetical protein